LAGSLLGFAPAAMRRRLPGIIDFAELGEFIDAPVKTYSSGMYARLAFALTTDIEPDALLVDEVLGVGDEFFMRKSSARIRELMHAGTSTVFVSHDLDFLIAHCNRMIWLDRGRIVRDGAPREVAAAYHAQADG